MHSIPASHLHIWLCQTAALSQDFLQQAKPLFLNSEENTRFERYKFERHKTAFLASRILLKTALQYYLGCTISDIHFIHNEYGKPELAPEINPQGLHFNLSHSDDYIIVAVHQDPLGIDTEKLDRKTDILNIARHNFHPREIAELQKTDDNALMGFYLWMLKEAYIKYIGKGLSQRLHEFYFTVNGQNLEFGFDLQPDTRVGSALLVINDQCTAAICHAPGPVEWSAKTLGDLGKINEANITILAQIPVPQK